MKIKLYLTKTQKLTQEKPHLSFDNFLINSNASSGKFNPYGWLRFEVKFIPRETGKKRRFSNTGITNQNYLV